MEKAQENYWRYEQIGRPKSCPKCDTAKMMNVGFSALVMSSNPPQQRWYWECEACKYQELGGVHVHKPIKINVAI